MKRESKKSMEGGGRGQKARYAPYRPDVGSSSGPDFVSPGRNDAETGNYENAQRFNGNENLFLPATNIARIMRELIPSHGTVSADAIEAVQRSVFEYVTFITGEANDHCRNEHRKILTADDILYAMAKLGFDRYVGPLTLFLNRYREYESERNAVFGEPYVRRRRTVLYQMPPPPPPPLVYFNPAIPHVGPPPGFFNPAAMNYGYYPSGHNFYAASYARPDNIGVPAFGAAYASPVDIGVPPPPNGHYAPSHGTNDPSFYAVHAPANSFRGPSYFAVYGPPGSTGGPPFYRAYHASSGIAAAAPSFTAPPGWSGGLSFNYAYHAPPGSAAAGSSFTAPPGSAGGFPFNNATHPRPRFNPRRQFM